MSPLESPSLLPKLENTSFHQRNKISCTIIVTIDAIIVHPNEIRISSEQKNGKEMHLLFYKCEIIW